MGIILFVWVRDETATVADPDMKKNSFFILFYIMGLGVSSKAQEKPVFQLNHVDISIDSASFNRILNNKFLRDSFAFIKVFTDSTGSEVLLLGQESFIHLLPDKGFFINRVGACLLVHHSFRWEETNTLKQYLQTFTRDSLYNRPYYSSDLSIDYINVFEKLAEEKKLLKFIPILQNHSKRDYLSWGYTSNDLRQGISQKKYMDDYVGKETEKKNFHSIIDISVAVAKKELERMKPLLLGYGYKKSGNRFILQGSPIINVTKMKQSMRVVSLAILLGESVETKTIFISDNVTFLMKNNKALLTFKISDNYR